MKKVFSSIQECAHVYAQNTQSEGRANSLIFDAKTIYSYGKHFPIATRLNDNVYLFTTRSYSVTTAKHINAVGGALSHKTLVYCNDPQNNIPSTNISKELEIIKQTAKEFGALKRKNTIRASDIHGKAFAAKNRIDILVDTLATHGLAMLNISMFQPDKNTLKEQLKICKKQQKEASKYIANFDILSEQLAKIEAKKQKAIAAKRKKDAIIQIAKFRAFESNHVDSYYISSHAHFSNTCANALLRFNTTSQNVETSKGVKISKADALLFYKAFKANNCVGLTLAEHYTITKVHYENKVVIAGCHTIPFNEIENCYKELTK